MNPDRLSRLAALRPAISSTASRRLSGEPRGNTLRLAELLAGESRTNELGCHLLVRRQFPERPPVQIGPRALRLLSPQSESITGDPADWIFLDTETTGLAGGTGTYAFLVGVAWWAQEGLTVEQFFMRDHCEEPALLHELARVLATRQVMVTFNGKSFDWPLLETRFRMARIGPVPSPPVHLDLLHPARRLWRYRLKSVALSELERYVLGLDRGYDIPSESIPGRYFDFLRGGPPEQIAEIFHHNQMDLRGLALLATHITRLLEYPENSAWEATDLYGMSRFLKTRGEGNLAGLFFERALADGLDGNPGRAAKRELALLAKHEGNLQRANQLWEDLVGSSNEGLEAYEQLAMYYEHRVRDFERAARLSRDALGELREALQAGLIHPHQYRRRHAEFQYRLDRLTRKVSGAK